MPTKIRQPQAGVDDQKERERKLNICRGCWSLLAHSCARGVKTSANGMVRACAPAPRERDAGTGWQL